MREGESTESNLETNNNNEQEIKNIKKKNRTLQYYKFLFYSIKTEIKVHEFVKLIHNSNMMEISIWILSIILYCSTPSTTHSNNRILDRNLEAVAQSVVDSEQKTKTYKNIFIFFHIFHVIRALGGIYLVIKFPNSNNVMKSLESNSDEKLERTLFNDLIRETIFFDVTEKIKSKKYIIASYVILTFINFVFDMLDFLIILNALSDATSDNKVILLSYLLMALLYIYIDGSYIFWTVQLRYIFPKEYLKPINSLFDGIVDKALVKFKLRKPKTNVISEDKAQKSNQPYVTSSNYMKDDGINILENIFSELGIYSGDKNEHEKHEPKNMEKKVDIENFQNIPGSKDAIGENKIDQ